MRKIYITLGSLLIAMLAMAYLYFANLHTETTANDQSLHAATANSGLVLSFENDKSFYEILSGQDLFQQLLGEQKTKQFRSLRNNLVDQANINQAIAGQRIYVAALPGEKDGLDFLVSTQLKPGTSTAQLLKHLGDKNQLTKKGTAYQLVFPDSSICYIGISDMLVLISNAPSPIQNALNGQKNNNQGFVDYIKTNSRFNKNTLASLFIDFNKIPALLKQVLNSNLTGELAIFNNQDAYAALSYNFSKEQLLFNGNTTVNTNKSYYQLFDEIQEQKITINNILPKNTANYVVYGIQDYAKWHGQLKGWMERHQEKEKTEKVMANINQKYRLDLEQTFVKYFKNQFTTFELKSGEKFGAIALSNGEKVNQLLLDLSSEYATDIRIIKEPAVFYALFGMPFKKFERPFYTIIDNYLVLANNASSVAAFLNSYQNDALLANDNDYIRFSNQFSSSATISFYVNNQNSNDIFGRNLKPAYYKHYQSKAGIQPFDAFSYQLSGDKGKFLSNLLLYQKPAPVAASADSTSITN